MGKGHQTEKKYIESVVGSYLSRGRMRVGRGKRKKERDWAGSQETEDQMSTHCS